MIRSNPSFWKPINNESGDTKGKQQRATRDTREYTFEYSLERQILPIMAHRTEILYALEKFGVLILVGETGSGKSTQLPQYLYENGWAADPDTGGYREIICTQPRRIAAITLANRIARELPSPDIVGYSVRFQSNYVPRTTKIRFVTDGWLLREITLLDPLLTHCSILIIDEAHERTIHTDLLLGAVKKIRRQRPHLRVVVCSATLDADAFLEFFVGKKNRVDEKRAAATINQNNTNGKRKKSRWGRLGEDNSKKQMLDTVADIDTSQECATRDGTILSVDGRLHPVDVMYIEQPVADYVKATVQIAIQIHDNETDDGDILAFLPTGESIDEAVEMAEHLLSSDLQDDATISHTHNNRRARNAICLPLYSALPPKEQTLPFLPRSQHEIRQNTRRIIFATNIAETSVTVPNIAHVIDCGFAKMPFFEPYSGFNRLIVCSISKASAQQRAGRAGRVRPGKCYRLYSEQAFLKFEDHTAPEIQRCDLTTLIMTIKAFGVKNLLSFDLMSVPSVEALSHGLESLYALGAMDNHAELTILGKEMVYFPTDPRVSRMLLASLHMELQEDTPSMVAKLIVGDVLTIAAVLQVENIFFQPRTERQWRSYDDAMADILDRSGDHVTIVHLFDLIDHTNKMLSEEECRVRFVNRVALQRAWDVRRQLSGFLKHRFGGGSHWFGSKRQEIVGSHGFDPQERSESIRKCVCAGFFMNVAKLGNDGRYYTLRGKYAVSLSSSSVLHRYGESSDYILFGETYDGNRGGIDVKACSSISGLWLRQSAPHYWT